MRRGPTRIGDQVGRELARLAPGLALTDVARAWSDAVGPGIAANAWPARLARDGTLHVAVRSSAWAFELTQVEATIRARLGEALGPAAPRRLRFALGPLPEPGPPSAQGERRGARTMPRAAPAEAAEGRRIASAIEDAKLRGLVARAAGASLAARERRERGGA